MRIVGLTGSIGMGKSTVAAMLRRMRVPVSCADETVHRLLAPRGRGFAGVAAAFPQAVHEGRIDRTVLGNAVFADPAALARLEAILHPLVAGERQRFLANCRRRKQPLVVLDIPLLFEKHLEKTVDAVITVNAPDFVRHARVLARPGMSPEKLAAILARQWPEAKRRQHSDAVLNTGQGRAATFRQLQAILKRLDSRKSSTRKRHARNRSRY